MADIAYIELCHITRWQSHQIPIHSHLNKYANTSPEPYQNQKWHELWQNAQTASATTSPLDEEQISCGQAQPHKPCRHCIYTYAHTYTRKKANQATQQLCEKCRLCKMKTLKVTGSHANTCICCCKRTAKLHSSLQTKLVQVFATFLQWTSWQIEDFGFPRCHLLSRGGSKDCFGSEQVDQF